MIPKRIYKIMVEIRNKFIKSDLKNKQKNDKPISLASPGYLEDKPKIICMNCGNIIKNEIEWLFGGCIKCVPKDKDVYHQCENICGDFPPIGNSDECKKCPNSIVTRKDSK